VQSSSTEGIKQAGKIAVKSLKESGSAKAEDLKKAIAKAKFAAASATDSRDNLINFLGSKVLAGSDASLDSVLSSLDNVNGAALSKAATILLNGKPTYVTVGNVQTLPYADELGL